MLHPRSKVAEPQYYYFFPHTPWIRQQHVTQWLSTWLYHGCVCVCVCVHVYVDVCVAALRDFCTHIATKICAHKPNTMFVLGCVCLLRNMIQFL